MRSNPNHGVSHDWGYQQRITPQRTGVSCNAVHLDRHLNSLGAELIPVFGFL